MVRAPSPITPTAPARQRAASFWFGPSAILAILGLLLSGTPSRARADQDACLAAHEAAQLQRLRGRYLEAREQLIACAQAACPSLVRADCKTWLDQVEDALPSIVFAVADEAGRDVIDVRISHGGALLSERADGRALPLNPGVYSLRFEAEGHAAHEQQLSVREGEKQRLVRVTLRAQTTGAVVPEGPRAAVAAGAPAYNPEARRARRLTRAAYVLAGLSVASLATGITLGVLGKRDLEELEDQGCKPNCDEGEVNAGKRKYVVADIAFGAAGALFSAAVVTFVFGWRKQRAQDRPLSPRVALDATGVSFGWDMRF